MDRVVLMVLFYFILANIIFLFSLFFPAAMVFLAAFSIIYATMIMHFKGWFSD